MKGIFNLKPPGPRYNAVWDVKDVLNYLRSLDANKNLSLQWLTLKLCMLLALVSRCQTLCALRVDSMTVLEDKVTFSITSLLKTSRRDKVGRTLNFQAYSLDDRVCIKETIIEYCKQTKELRGQETQLLLSFVPPHNRVGTDSIARWIKIVLAASGIDTNQFKAHSSRAAAVSACVPYLPVQDIVKRAGWSNEQTFQKIL